MHEVLGDLPVTWAGMTVTYHEWPPGKDSTPRYKGLPDDKCPCPHWGYMIKGSIHIGYTGGTEEVTRAGEAFYLPPGHTVWTDEGADFVLLNPEKEFSELVEHIQKRREEHSKQDG